MDSIKSFFKHAFGLRTIAPIAVSGFSGWVALADRHMLVDDPEFLALLIGGLGLGVISWAAIAYDGWKKEKEAKAQQAIQVELLKEIRALRPNPVPTSLAHIRDWSSATLKEKVGKLTSEMRSLEGGYIKQSQEIQNQWRSALGDRRESWNKMQREHDTLAAKRLDRFRSRILPDALALREEMRHRLGDFPPTTPAHRETALDYGMLVGPSPLAEAALALEAMAERLPD